MGSAQRTTGKAPPHRVDRVRRLNRLAVVLALIVASLAFPPRSVFAYSCAGDSWADGVSWTDNQWWADGCPDNHGEMVRAIQVLVNENYPYCSAGDDDGYWGTNTKNGVKCYQTYKGLTSDGIVGPSTWGQRASSPYTGLMSELVFMGSSDGKLWYRTDLQNDRVYQVINTGLWYLYTYCDEGLYVGMYSSGPTYNGCVPPWW